MAKTDILLVQGLCCQRDWRVIFHDLAFSLESGQALMLTGGNGRGKTSLIRILAGLSPPQGGHVSWNGDSALGDPGAHAERLVYVGHANPVPPLLTVREILTFHAGLAGRPDRVETALSCFSLGRVATWPGHALSAGWKRRVSLARLLLDDRPLWLLDEPAAGLDTEARQELQTRIERHCGNGGMAIFSSHGDIAVPGAGRLDLDSLSPAASRESAP